MEDNFTIGRRTIAQDAMEREKLFIKTYNQEDVPAHNHDFFELVYVTGGTTCHTLRGSSGPLGRGNYFIVDYGSKHSYAQSKDLTLINCLFLPEMIDDSLSGCHSFGSLLHVCLLRYYKLHSEKNPANRIFFDSGGRILDILSVMQKELEEKSVGYQEVLKNRLLEIIIITMRNIVDQSLQNAKSEITRQMIEYIHCHYREHGLLTAYCKTHHYSLPYASRKFKQETGYTVGGYTQKIRVEKSCELLASGPLAISEVAEAVGYADIKTFDTLFRKMIHKSPREYRKSSVL